MTGRGKTRTGKEKYGKKRDKKRNGIRNLLYKPAAFLTDRFILRSSGRSREVLAGEIRALAFGRHSAVRDYYIKKTADVMALFAVVLLAAGILIPVLYKGGGMPPDEGLARGDYSEGVIREELLASIEGESENELLTLALHQRTFTKEEALRLLEQAKGELELLLKGENPSLDEVREDLVMPSGLQEGFVSAEYLTIPYGIISEDGKVTSSGDEKGELVEIRATLTCQEETLLYETAAMVFPPRLDERQRLRKKLQDLLRENEEATRTEARFKLPEEVEGKTLKWSFPGNGEWRFVLLLLVLPVLLYIRRDEHIHELAANRQNQLLIDYPDIMWKLTMLLSAGLTIRGAVYRIAAGYGRARETGQIRKPRYAYEELVYTCREMHTGVEEGRSYLNFGKRCALPGYIKLGTLLAQNLRKGSAGLAAELEREAGIAMEERIKAARKQGEQAATRLLFPMILMLGVVLAVLMVPAIMVMG